MKNLFIMIFTLAILSAAPVAAAPSKDLIDQDVLKDIGAFVNADIVRMSIENQNKKYAGLDQAHIDDLDKQWRAETEAEDQPLISATLSNPLSSYLTRTQARSTGLYVEIFAMDRNGLNVGQSGISSDMWQGDEDKFQKSFPLGAGAVFIDEPEYDEETKSWRSQVNLTVASEAGEPIGAMTVEINLTELARRKARDYNIRPPQAE